MEDKDSDKRRAKALFWLRHSGPRSVSRQGFLSSVLHLHLVPASRGPGFGGVRLQHGEVAQEDRGRNGEKPSVQGSSQSLVCQEVTESRLADTVRERGGTIERVA